MAKPKSADKNTSAPAKKRGRPPNNPPAPGNPTVKPAKAPKAEKATESKVTSKIEVDDAQEQALFNHHFPKIQAAKEQLESANSALRALYKAAKADGLTKPDFDIGAAVATAEKEAKLRAELMRTVQVAKWCGSDIGQLAFDLADRVPAVDRAHEEGRVAAQRGETAKPGYDPSTEQHREYMRGFHEATEAKIKAGIQKLEPADDSDELDGVEDYDDLPAEIAAVESPIIMNRADFERQRNLAVAETDSSIFRKRAN